ncbi:hypothetical protein [Nonlabens sp. Asnod2-A12]|uniref:hypothetical protein n=1 Tax=Nonlabens sp. Asnod2-A12 TaxID=3160578 RepID=UPI003868C62C
MEKNKFFIIVLFSFSIMFCVSLKKSTICFQLKNGKEVCLNSDDIITEDYGFTILNKEKLNSLKGEKIQRIFVSNSNLNERDVIFFNIFSSSVPENELYVINLVMNP